MHVLITGTFRTVALSLAAASCAMGDTGARPSSASGVAPDVCGLPAAIPLRRLSHTEYRNTVRDLFGGKLRVDVELPADGVGRDFDNDADALAANPLLVDSYHSAAMAIARAAVAAPASLEGSLSCSPTGDPDADARCGRSFIAAFGARAFRRALADAEVEEFAALFESQRTAIDFSAAVELTIASLLEQPEFLYRLEVPQGAGSMQAYRIDPIELASRLSYLIWQSMPDEDLAAAAATGRLGSAAEVSDQVARMLRDPRARAMVIDFHRQWLELDRITAEEDKSQTLYPAWSRDLARAMREESDRFVGDVMYDQKGTFRALHTSPRTWVNPALASFYGVAAPPAGGAWSAALLPGDQRAGILTRGNFLASHAHAQNGSPPLRGNAVLGRVFCSAVPPPPADADQSNPALSPSAAPRTNRQLFEERTSPGACAPCHRILNGVGYGLENYDATGAFRTTDHGLPVDSSGELVGTDVDGPYAGPLELADRIAGSLRAKTCLVSSWYRFARGEARAGEDTCRIQRLVDRFTRDGESFVGLVAATAVAPEAFNGVTAP